MSLLLYITTLCPGRKPADVTAVVKDNSTMENEDVNSPTEVTGPCQLPDLETINGAFFIFIFILSVTGNILLLSVLVVYENLKNVTNLFVINLACSDLVFTVTLPFWAVHSLHHWIFGELACKLLTAAYIVGMYSSVILLTAMTVDRFITVVLNWPSKPVKRQRCAIGACVAAWIISIAASIRDAMLSKITWDEVYICEVEESHSLTKLGFYLQVSLLFFLPFAIIVFCYSAIIKTVLQASNRKKYRTIVVVFCIVTAFFICWGPYNVFLFVWSLYEPTSCHEVERFEIAYAVSRIVAFSHCCMNPLLYMLSQKTRRHLYQLLHCENPKTENRERGTAGQSISLIQHVAFTVQNTAITLDLPSK